MELLVSGSKFDSYTIDAVLSNSYEYRAVYRAISEDDGPAVLVVYDMDAYPGRKVDLFGMCVPSEFYFAYLLQKEVSPEMYDIGENSTHGHLCWMSQEFVFGLSLNLHYAMCYSDSLSERMQLVSELSARMRKFQERLPHFAHYNLVPENILITVDENDQTIPVVIGLSHVDLEGSTFRKHPENSSNLIYKAPEMLTGSYSASCDVYALAVICCEILTGHHPWGTHTWHKQKSFTQSKASLRSLRKDCHFAGSIPNDVELLLRKSLMSKAKRYMNTTDFDMALRDVLGDDFEANEVEETPLPVTHEDCAALPDDDTAEVDEEEDGVDEAMPGADGGRPKSRVKLRKKKGCGFASVAGMEQLKSDLTQNFINVLRYPDMAKSYGIEPPNGMLLYGPPGCGKTYIAARLAEEVGINASFVRPSDLGSTFIHGSQSMIADLFSKAEKCAPSILVFDEIDALVPSRASLGDNVSYHGEVNEFLTQLESCSQRGIFVVGTTNRIENIDSAVLRTGRIEEVVYVPLPDRDNRLALFKMELKGKPCQKDIDYERLVDLTERFTMSDVSYVVKKACRMAFDKAVTAGIGRHSKIGMELLLEAIEKTTPSVDAKAEKEYERQHQEYDGRKKYSLTAPRPIGFRASR